MKIDTTKYAAMVANAAARVKISSTVFKNFIADVKSVIDGNDDVVTAHLADDAAHGLMQRQAIINGNFDIWQRGTSFTNPSTAAYTADRFYNGSAIITGTAPTSIIHQKLSVTPGDILGAANGYRVNVNGAGTGYGVSDQYSVRQKIEHGTRYLCGAGKKVTLSFWAKSDIAGKRLGVSAVQNYGTGGSPSAAETLQGEIITLTSSWTKYSVTVDTNTLVGKTFGSNNDDWLGLLIFYVWGTTIATSNFGGGTAETFGGSGNIDIAQIHVHAGEEELPFPVRSYAEELALCRRYCLVFTDALNSNFPIGYGFAVTSTISLIGVSLPTEMRTQPTLVATASDFLLLDGIATISLTAISIQPNQNGKTALTLRAEVASGLTAFRPYTLAAVAATKRLILDAEL